MEALFNFILVSVGLTFIVTDSEILKSVKAMIKSDFIWDLLSCAQCFGFWAGLGISFWYGVNPLVGGLIVSGVCFILTKVFRNEG